jgi:hydrogenase maturation protease
VTDLLILGLGNLLCCDDGVGVAALSRLMRGYEAPEGVLMMDGGTLGLSLLPYLQDARRVILVDAIAAKGPPGSPVRLEGEDVAHAVLHRLSPHQVGVADLLDGARILGDVPDEVVLVGVVPASMELSIERTPEVEAAIPDLVARVVREAARLGHPLVPRGGHDTPAPDDDGPDHVDRAFGL